MSSEIKANKWSPATGTAATLGDSGDTFTIPAGATITNSGTATGFGKVLQVVHVTDAGPGTQTSSSSWVDTDTTASITCSATTSKVLVMFGGSCTGYRASVSGSKLKLQLGFSHDIDYEVPKEVKVECPKQNIIKLSSFNKAILGATAAKIRSYRKPEPFKGKGIKYQNEFIFRKEGKKK